MNEHWLERWQEGRIGWHEPEGNASLQKYWTRVRKAGAGAALWQDPGSDLARSAREMRLSASSCRSLRYRAFFDENEIAYSLVEGALTAYVAEDRSIKIYCGDYFEFSEGPFDAYYDRGALVAMPPNLRGKYVEHTRSLLAADAAQLIISLEYDDVDCDRAAVPGASRRNPFILARP